MLKLLITYEDTKKVNIKYFLNDKLISFKKYSKSYSSFNKRFHNGVCFNEYSNKNIISLYEMNKNEKPEGLIIVFNKETDEILFQDYRLNNKNHGIGLFYFLVNKKFLYTIYK